MFGLRSCAGVGTVVLLAAVAQAGNAPVDSGRPATQLVQGNRSRGFYGFKDWDSDSGRFGRFRRPRAVAAEDGDDEQTPPKSKESKKFQFKGKLFKEKSKGIGGGGGGSPKKPGGFIPPWSFKEGKGKGPGKAERKKAAKKKPAKKPGRSWSPMAWEKGKGIGEKKGAWRKGGPPPSTARGKFGHGRSAPHAGWRGHSAFARHGFRGRGFGHFGHCGGKGFRKGHDHHRGWTMGRGRAFGKGHGRHGGFRRGFGHHHRRHAGVHGRGGRGEFGGFDRGRHGRHRRPGGFRGRGWAGWSGSQGRHGAFARWDGRGRDYRWSWSSHRPPRHHGGDER